MRFYHAIWIALVCTTCSRDTDHSDSGDGSLKLPREMSGISCPIHEMPVFKEHASTAISCYGWDPKRGLSIDEIRLRFPYAIWDSNIYRIDDSPDAQFPQYYLVCDRCMASWKEYATANPASHLNQRLVIEVATKGQISINDTQFSVEQISAIAKSVSVFDSDAEVNLRAHRSAPTEVIKAIVNACTEGGLTRMIFQFICRRARYKRNAEQVNDFLRFDIRSFSIVIR